MTDEQGAQHLIQFIENLYYIFPELEGLDVSFFHLLSSAGNLADSKTYFAGESYAGQYIPYFGKPSCI